MSDSRERFLQVGGSAVRTGVVLLGAVATVLGASTLLMYEPSPRPDIVNGFTLAFASLFLTWGAAAVALGLSLRAVPLLLARPVFRFTNRDRRVLRGAAAALAGGPIAGFAIFLASTSSGPANVPSTLTAELGGTVGLGFMFGVPVIGAVAVVFVLVFGALRNGSKNIP